MNLRLPEQYLSVNCILTSNISIAPLIHQNDMKSYLKNFTSLPLLYALCCPVLLTGCASPTYYSQAAFGQLELWTKSRSIQEVIDDKTTSTLEKKKLITALNILEFAEEQLLLPAEGSYQAYVKLNRRHVVWNVFAAPKDSLNPKTSCFVIAGCLPYRGYFSKADANEHARKLNKKGYDTYIAGVKAYSTLGWLNDPILSTIIEREDVSLAQILFHELSHQKIYVKNDAQFNEGFAMAIADHGAMLWAADRNTNFNSSRKNMEPELIKLVIDTKHKLNLLYSSNKSLETKMTAKKKYFQDLALQYRTLKQNWSGENIYDDWMAEGWNNARVLTVATYYDYVPYFEALIKQCSPDFEILYKKIMQLSQLKATERREIAISFTTSKKASTTCR